MDFDANSDMSSPLSSIPSLSPSPPDFYPSPSSSQEYSDVSLPTDGLDPLPAAMECDGPPPAKKRKIAEPKPRTTKHLNLFPTSDPVTSCQSSELDLLLKVLRKRRKVVVIAGAGISVSAGVPDFRSSTGLFTTLRGQHNLKGSGKDLFDASVYRTDSSTSSFHDMVRSLSHLVTSAQPTAFHHLLATLAQEGRLLRLYSQNVDGIDTSLPPLATKVPLNTKGPWPRTIQLHGGLEKMVCQKCHNLSDFQAALFDGPEPPSCPQCMDMDHVRTTHAGKRSHGIGRLRPRMVLYNEHNPDDEAIGAVTTADLRSRPDAIIVVGTSLKIPGVRRIVREMCGVVRGRRDGVAIWINNDPEPLGREFENCWDLVVRGDCEEVAKHAALRRWDDNDIGKFAICTAEEMEKVKREKGLAEVVVHTPKKNKSFKELQGVLTPIASPVFKPAPKLKVVASERPAKLEAISKAKKNPASKGAPISEILKKAPPGTAKSSKKGKPQKAPKKTSTIKDMPKITNTFKVTKKKPPTTFGKGSKTTKSALPKALQETSLSPPLPMHPISPQEARNNTQCSQMFPNLSKTSILDTEKPLPFTDSNMDTVSPKGPLPAHLAKILN
ncbi:MAG: hypothetical protein M1812_007139 [Candelaria pacifica]|nr:MAG: hypothetical protein M1812_007139 [Candelaria pacifica]